MAELTVVPITKAGIADISAADVPADVAGDSVNASSGIFVMMQNDDAAPHTLTVAKPSASASCSNLGSLAVEDITLIVAAGNKGMVSIPSGYTDSNGNYSWTYDAVTSVGIAVFSIAP